MKVKMTAPTYWNGKKLKTGDPANVTKDVAERWEEAGIAKIVEDKKPNDKPLERMNTEELTQRAAVLGVDITAYTTNKQRADAIQAFIDTQTPEDDGEDEEENEE